MLCVCVCWLLARAPSPRAKVPLAFRAPPSILEGHRPRGAQEPSKLTGMEGGRRTPWVTASHRQPPPGAVLPSVALLRTAAPPRPVPPPSAGVCASALPCASGVSPLGLICLRPAPPCSALPLPLPPCHSPPSPPVPCPAAQIRSTRSPSSEGLQHGLPNSSSLRWHLWPSPAAWRTSPKPSMYS
jgi:hypothetical protein